MILKKISTIDAVLIVLMAACGLALKPIIGPLFKLIGSMIFLPSGSIAGSIYMIWPMLALLIVRQTGTATLVGLIQGIVVLITGIYGSHGILSLVTYTVPGLFIDFGYLLVRRFQRHWVLLFPPALGSLVADFLVTIIFLHLPTIPLIISLVLAFISGGVSGYFSWFLYNWLIKKFPLLEKQNANFFQ